MNDAGGDDGGDDGGGEKEDDVDDVVWWRNLVAVVLFLRPGFDVLSPLNPIFFFLVCAPPPPPHPLRQGVIEGDGYVMWSDRYYGNVMLPIELRAGKWYWEIEYIKSNDVYIGVVSPDFDGRNCLCDAPNAYTLEVSCAQLIHDSSYSFGTLSTSYQEGDVIGCCFDADARTLTWSKDGTFVPGGFTGMKVTPGAPLCVRVRSPRLSCTPSPLIPTTSH